jgi:hypothetical protein
MSWLSMMAELGVNINPFVRGMNRARQEADKAGTKIGKDLKQKLWGAFGVGAIGMGVKSLFGDSKQIEQMAFRFQKSTKEVQAMQYAADRTGLSFNEVMGILDGTAEDVLPGMRDRVGELVTEFDRLGVAIADGTVKQMNAASSGWDNLVLKFKSSMATSVGIIGSYFGKFDWKKMRFSEDFFSHLGSNEVAQLVAETDTSVTPGTPKAGKEKATKKVEKAIRAAKFDLGAEVGNLPVDQMASVGGFLGNASKATPVVDIAREQLKVQQKIAENTDPEKRETAQFSSL